LRQLAIVRQDRTMKHLRLGLKWIAMTLPVLVVGCSGDAIEGMSDSGTTAGDTTGDSEATSSASQTSTSGAGTSSTTTGMTSSSSTADTGVSSSGEDTGKGTTGGDACADLPRDECTEARDCEPIACSPFVMMDIGVTPWCIGETEFVGCRTADKSCNEVRTTTCEGDDATVYVCTTDCIPDGWLKCDPPVQGGVQPCM
jgi:hypothetical protein